MKKRLLEYKNYTGSIDFDLNSRDLFGKVLFVNDTVIYQGKDLDELEKSFRESIEEYLETCEELNKNPDKPFSGTFNIRIEPELHKNLSLKVEQLGLKSINSAVTLAIQSWIGETAPQTEVTHQHNHTILIENVIESVSSSGYQEYTTSLNPNLRTVN